MKPLLRAITALHFLAGAILPAQGRPPRWGFLGDDKDLTSTYDASLNAVLVCISATELRKVKPPFAEIVHHATVVGSYKGGLKIGDKIRIDFPTDSLPTDEEKRGKFIEDANQANQGALRIAFLQDGAEGNYSCEWLNVPRYQKVMHDFLRELKPRPVDVDVTQPGVSGQPNHGLFLRIGIPGRQFAPGSPITVSCAIKNLATTPMRTWHSGFWPNHQIRVCDQDGKPATLREFGKSRFDAFSPGGDRDKNFPVDIQPGAEDASDGAPQDITQLYDLSTPGTYSVQVLYEEYQGGWEGQLWSNVILILIADQ